MDDEDDTDDFAKINVRDAVDAVAVDAVAFGFFDDAVTPLRRYF